MYQLGVWTTSAILKLDQIPTIETPMLYAVMRSSITSAPSSRSGLFRWIIRRQPTNLLHDRAQRGTTCQMADARTNKQICGDAGRKRNYDHEGKNLERCY
jgi:hypothetical protein